MVSQDDSDDRTRVGPTLPPQPKMPATPPAKAAPPSQTPAVSRSAGAVPPSAKDESDDKTHIGAMRPPVRMPATPPVSHPAAPPAAATDHDQTHLRNVPPPAVGSVQPPTPIAQPNQPPEAGAEEETVIMPKRALTAAARLQRLQPPGRSDMIILDRTSYRLGRSHSADIELFSPSASREHAQLTNRDGRWSIIPAQDRVVRANGVEVRGETALTHKARLQLGGDELLFLNETAPAERAPKAPTRRYGKLALAVTALVLIAGIAAAVWWLQTNP